MSQRTANSAERTAHKWLSTTWVLAVSCALLAARSPLFAFGNDDVGTSGAAFLKIGPGARPVGMGEAFTAVADDVHAVYWNPAGLGLMKNAEITGMHMEYFENIAYEFAAFAVPTGNRGTWAVAISNLHTDDLERRTEDTDAAIGDFKASDSAYWLSYGKTLNSRFTLGASAKYIRQTLDTSNASAFATDLGALYLTDWHDMRLGLAVQNFGSKVKFENESDPLPLTTRLGASMSLLQRKMLVSSDIIMPRDHEIGVALGTEYKGRITTDLRYAVRAGYRTDSDVDGFKGASIGSGLALGRGGLDFAWVPFGDLGNAYRFSLHVKFGPQSDDLDVPGHTQMKKASSKDAQKKSDLDQDVDSSALEQLLAL